MAKKGLKGGKIMTNKPRYKADKNITNSPYIYDKENNRQYWLDEDAYIIACIMNKYEDKINELETYIDSKEYLEFPTRFDTIIDNVAGEFKRRFRRALNWKQLKHADGWKVETIQQQDGNKYKVTLTIIEED